MTKLAIPLNLHSVFAATLLVLAACTPPSNTDERHISASADASSREKTLAGKSPSDTNWPRYGGDTDETHYSALSQINNENIERLGLAWFTDLPAGPGTGVSGALAVDGTLYFSTGLSVLNAVDAKTGQERWQYDPNVPALAGEKLRAGWGVRGIAYADGKVITGTLDGRLIAVDAESGQLIWSTYTLEGPTDGRYITGPAYIAGGLVLIGHGGGDYAPVRGYVSAYDVTTGEAKWKFYTVPGNPADGFENDAMAMAAETWNGDWWEFGGGGTVWHAMAYDPEQSLVFIGTGNGSPWNQKIRSPGGGDNLFVCSIIALDAETGEYAWHYQINPGETWDYNANMDIQLLDMTLNGEIRKVLITAPKNGFFYVIDRTTGALISAEKFAEANWAERIDIATGRPIENPAARYPAGTAFMTLPAAWGAHGVEAMGYNPDTGLVYIPARDRGNIYTDPENLESWTHRPGMVIDGGLGAHPRGMTIPPAQGWLSAWDPKNQREKWRIPLPHTHNGGVLTTGGNLVFQGRADGEFSAYHAETGEPLWSFDAQNGIHTHPISYTVDGKQYISLLVGWRASTWDGQTRRWPYRTQKRRLLTFTLDGQSALPESALQNDDPILDDIDFVVDEELASHGRAMYHSVCSVCHGAGLRADGAAPDLTRSSIPLDTNALKAVVLEGALVNRGMGRFEHWNERDVEAVQHYIRQTARIRLQPSNY